MLSSLIFPKIWKIVENWVLCEYCVCGFFCHCLHFCCGWNPADVTGNFTTEFNCKLQSVRLLHCVLLNTKLMCFMCGEEKAELTEQCSSSWATLWVSWSCDRTGCVYIYFSFIFSKAAEGLGKVLWPVAFWSCSLSLVKEVCVVKNAPARCSLGHGR